MKFERGSAKRDLEYIEILIEDLKRLNDRNNIETCSYLHNVLKNIKEDYDLSNTRKRSKLKK